MSYNYYNQTTVIEQANRIAELEQELALKVDEVSELKKAYSTLSRKKAKELLRCQQSFEAEIEQLKATIKARDDECRVEHYEALNGCIAELDTLRAQLDAEQQSVNELSLANQDLNKELATLRAQARAVDGLENAANKALFYILTHSLNEEQSLYNELKSAIAALKAAKP